MKRKSVVRTAAAIVLASVMAVPAAVTASAPYEAYTYNYYEDAVPLPAPYLPEKAVSGDSLGVGAFNQPNDMFVTEDGYIYILDSGNARVISLDRDWNVIREIKSFQKDGQEDGFSGPTGLFVTPDKLIYVADTGKNRVVVLTGEGELVKVVEKPESDILPADFQFFPLKVTVDQAGRIFAVARGVFEGIMQFDDQGDFMGYVGTIKVQPTLWDRIWKKLSTKTQKQQMELFIPTEFANVDIDSKGFVYATTIDVDSDETIKRLNPSGQDVIKRFGPYPNKGDIRYRIFGNNAGPSKLTDVKVIGGGMYVVLDSHRARLFGYNGEGELLYAFGGRGSQLGVFNTPVAVERAGDRLLVLDRGKNNIVVFRPTKFGSLVHQATALHDSGNDAEAVEIWKQVLRLNTNYDIAYLGIGKSLLMQKKNKEAMEYFKLGMERKSYSVAYKRYRREVMQEHFGTIMTVIFAFIATILLYRVVRKAIGRRAYNREAGVS